MSRIANNPVSIPKGVEITLKGQEVTVKGSKGNLTMILHDLVGISQVEDRLQLKAVEVSKASVALAGTSRSLVNNMVLGVSSGFQKELQLQGVGYRAQAQGKKLNLSLGFSHPVVYEVPEGIDIETPTQTQVIVKELISS